MEDKVVDFHRFVLRARRRHNYELSHILNMDATPMRFELPATRTLEFTGNRTVPILSCGGDKHSFTVVLALKANGEKLLPKVIFKGVRQLRIQIPLSMQVSVHKKGWMDEEGIFLLLFIFRTSFDWTVVQHGDCQICDIIRIMFPKHVPFNWHYRYRSSDNKYVLISFCLSPDQSCFFFFLL